MEKSPHDLREKLIIEICSFEDITSVLKNSFGNYVIQKALEVAQGEMLAMLGEKV